MKFHTFFLETSDVSEFKTSVDSGGRRVLEITVGPPDSWVSEFIGLCSIHSFFKDFVNFHMFVLRVNDFYIVKWTSLSKMLLTANVWGELHV